MKINKLLILTCILFLSNISKSFAVCDPNLTVCPSGCDYTVLNTAVTDLETNCSGTGDLTIEISGYWSSADTTQVGIGIPDVTIYTTGDARHSGVIAAGNYQHEEDSDAGNSIGAYQQDEVVIDGLIVKVRGNSNARGISMDGGPSAYNSTVKNCIVYAATGSAATGREGIYQRGNGSLTYNNIVYDIDSTTDTGIYLQTGRNDFTYNNTTYGNTVGMTFAESAETKVGRNNLSYGNDTDYTGTIDTHSNNAASDTTSPDDAYDSVTVTFENAAGRDFHLVVGDTDVIDEGYDLSGTFTDDIDGDTRSGTWDIGADEFVGGETPARRVMMLL